MVKADREGAAEGKGVDLGGGRIICKSMYLVPEIVKFLKLAKLLVVLSVPLVGVMTSPAVPNVWVQPLCPASETKYLWPPVSGPSPVNDQALVQAYVGVLPPKVSAALAWGLPLLLASVKL